MKSLPRRLRAEDMAAGTVLPVISLDVSFARVAMTPMASWDMFPGHHEPEFAHQQGQKTIYLNYIALQGFADRVITDWAGPAVFIARRRMVMKASVYAGDILHGGGKVVRVDRENGQHRVELAIWLKTDTVEVADVETSVIVPVG